MVDEDMREPLGTRELHDHDSELGADTEMVLVELGDDWDQIGAMRESGAI